MSSASSEKASNSSLARASAPKDIQAVAAHSFYTNKPITVAAREELQNPDALLLRAFADAGYISFLTVGGKENRAWPIRKGTTAWEAAGTIHSDIQKGFIRAEVISFADFIQAGGETQAKRAGKHGNDGLAEPAAAGAGQELDAGHRAVQVVGVGVDRQVEGREERRVVRRADDPKDRRHVRNRQALPDEDSSGVRAPMR